MNPSSLHIQSHMTGQSRNANAGHLSEVEKYFTRKDYGPAFGKLVFFFSSQEPENEVKRAYGYLCNITPHLKEAEIRSIYDKIFPVLDLFSQLTQQQLDLALTLASWYAARSLPVEETPCQNTLQAM